MTTVHREGHTGAKMLMSLPQRGVCNPTNMTVTNIEFIRFLQDVFVLFGK